MHNDSFSLPSTRRSSLDSSYSDIGVVQFDVDLDMELAQDGPVGAELAAEHPRVEANTAVTERDPIYFCETVFLQAEDRVFSVPKSGLVENGTFFESLFNQRIDCDAATPVAGSAEKHPLILEGISKIHFHNILRLIYPFRGVDPPSGDEHWLGILDLSTKWGFQEIRETALTHLSHLFTSPCRDVIRALHLCQKYNIHEHIKYQYEALVTSITPLNRAALLAVGIDEETILPLMQLREQWLCGMLWGEKGSGTGFGGFLPCRISARKIVEDHFSSTDSRRNSAGSIRSDAKAERAWEEEEMARLTGTVKHLEQMEKVAIEAESKGLEKARETREMTEEAVERKDVAEQEITRELESKAPEMGRNEQTEGESTLPQLSDADDLHHLQTFLGVFLSADVRHRLTRLILLHADKYELLKQIQELESKGTLDENNSSLTKLKSAVHQLEWQMRMYWQAGTDQTSICNEDPQSVMLEKLDEPYNIQKIERTLERLLCPGVTSLKFSTCMSAGKKTVSKQKITIKEFAEFYGLLPYTRENPLNSKISTTDIPEEMFGEWLAEFKRLANARKC